MYSSAKADYALRALAEPAAADVVRGGLRGVLERVTSADLAAGRFPAPVRRLLADQDAWRPH